MGLVCTTFDRRVSALRFDEARVCDGPGADLFRDKPVLGFVYGFVIGIS